MAFVATGIKIVITIRGGKRHVVPWMETTYIHVLDFNK